MLNPMTVHLESRLHQTVTLKEICHYAIPCFTSQTTTLILSALTMPIFNKKASNFGL